MGLLHILSQVRGRKRQQTEGTEGASAPKASHCATAGEALWKV